jgi:flagellar FliL protein
MSTAAATDTPAGGGGGSSGGGSNKLLLIVVLVFNVLIAAGLGYQVVLGRAKPAAGHLEGGDKHEPKEAAEHFGPLIEVGALVANLSGALSGHYAKVFLHVEGKDEKAKVRIEEALVPIRAEALFYLNGLEVKDVEGQVQMRTMAEALKTKLNALIGKDMIKRVYFSEFVIQ